MKHSITVLKIDAYKCKKKNVKKIHPQDELKISRKKLRDSSFFFVYLSSVHARNKFTKKYKQT